MAGVESTAQMLQPSSLSPAHKTSNTPDPEYPKVFHLSQREFSYVREREVRNIEKLIAWQADGFSPGSHRSTSHFRLAR
jgi:hypothetical protein